MSNCCNEFFKEEGTEPSEPSITGTIDAVMDHIFCTSIFKSVYRWYFSLIFWDKRLSPGMAMSIRKACFFVKSTQIMSGLLWGKYLSVCTVKSHRSFILSFCITDGGQWSQYLVVHSRPAFLTLIIIIIIIIIIITRTGSHITNYICQRSNLTSKWNSHNSSHSTSCV